MPKLTVTLNEVENGLVAIHGDQERRDHFKYMASKRKPIAIRPIVLRDGSRISAISPTGEVTESNEPVISFRPIWCKVFTVNSAKKDDITRLVVEFEFGKYMFSVDGVNKADLTTGGNGTDPKVIRRSEILLGDILELPRVGNVDEIIAHLESFIQKRFV